MRTNQQPVLRRLRFVLLVLALGVGAPVLAPAAPAATASNTSTASTASQADVRWVGDGTPGGCTSRAVVRAIAQGGVIRFRCGPDPIRIEMRRTAKVVNTSPRVVVDGGGLVTLSGGGQRRILYQNTCDRRQVQTTSHCQDQATPRLVLRNLRLVDGNATGETLDGGGGGAVFARGGRLSIVETTFDGNRCDRTGPTSAAAPSAPSRSTTDGRYASSAARSRAAGAATGRR